MATSASRAFYASPEWKALRRLCLQRDRYTCTVPGCHARATHADHIETRPSAAKLTPADRLDNLRSLCASHDSQVKEKPDGTRQNGGRFVVRGADADGWPLDPLRRRA